MNIEKLKRLERRMRRIRHEEHYDQAVFGRRTTCGTAACLAGHTVAIEGYKLLLGKYDDASTEWCLAPGKSAESDDEQSILETARQILGLNEGEARTLFTGTPEGAWPEEFAVRWRAATLGEWAPSKGNSTRRKLSGERPSRIAADLLKAIIEGSVTL